MTVELFQTCVKQAASIKVLIRKVATDKSLEGKEVTHDTQYHLLHCHLPDEPFLLRLVFYSADQCFLVFDQPTTNTMTPFFLYLLITSSTSLWWGGSLHSSTSGLCALASNLVWATFRGFPLFLIACLSASICFSWSYISCMVLDMWDCSLLCASLDSVILCWKDMLVLFQWLHISLAHCVIRLSTSPLRRWEADLAAERGRWIFGFYR